jgi:hypothetical protein
MNRRSADVTARTVGDPIRKSVLPLDGTAQSKLSSDPRQPKRSHHSPGIKHSRTEDTNSALVIN